MHLINKPNSLIAISMLAAFSLTGCDNSTSTDIPKLSIQPKNVILMISDGASDGAWDIASYWENGKLANNSAPYTKLSTRFAMTTFPLSTNGPDTICGDEVETISYDKDQVWDETSFTSDPADKYQRPFAGYEYISKNVTDSAAAGTALATGHKTYNGAISVDHCGRPLESITHIAKANGLSTGIITSVQFDHATPAVFGANNVSRNNYEAIGHDMLTQGEADLIMGAGHPQFDSDGKLRTTANFEYKYINAEDWASLNSGILTPAGSDTSWSLIDNKADFESLANNTASSEVLTGPLFGLVPVGYTLQQGRTCTAGKNEHVAFDCDMTATVPSLQTMTQGAINYLSQNEKGFFLMVEGGAVDWAAHANQTARIIEEQVDFNHSVSAVIAWVEQNSNWDETLLIVTTDHGNSYVLGGASDQNAYAPVENPGKGVMPEVKYYSGDHTLELVRLYARGKGAETLSDFVKGNDEGYAINYNNIGSNGDYVDNTNVFDLMKQVIVAP
ncbi:alkaline phosphatase [Psychromonas antarctica]|uniref:alkaline phosphatase n=1 Tax=Psychromonas antarctica TaxID=67573 RepID=UPI001EE978A9|nr:alkaline phosphatase [Psychromonas antarctica]MCG6201787.1 alkaline phosphatase [Psychromonas antarctica]